jgi:glycosyltransferase involved in cell wall biosynthesis
MGEAGRRRAETEFSWNQIATQTREIYNALVH